MSGELGKDKGTMGPGSSGCGGTLCKQEKSVWRVEITSLGLGS